MKIKDLLKLFYSDVYFGIRIIDHEQVTLCQEVTTAERFMDNHKHYCNYEIEEIEVGNKEVIFHVKGENINA